MPPMPLFMSFPHPYHRHPNQPSHLFCHCTHNSESPTSAVPHPLLTCLILPHLQCQHHNPKSLLYTIRKMGMVPMSLRKTPLFTTIFCACSSNFSLLISACYNPNWYPRYVMLAPINFAHSNPLYFSHSDLLFSLRAALLDPICSNLIAIISSNLFPLLLSASFFYISPLIRFNCL